MKLERIKIEGFKSIRELDLELRPLNVLIGANGAGKSNFISMFQMLNAMLERRFQLYVRQRSAEMLLHYGSKNTNEIKVRLSFDTGYSGRYNGYEVAWVPTDEDTLIFQSENTWFHNREQYDVPLRDTLGSAHIETNLFKRSASSTGPLIVDYVIRMLRGCKVYHFHDTSPEAGIKKIGDIDDNKSLRPDASNLAAFLYRLREMQPEYYRRIIKTIQLAAPFFDDFDLEPSRLVAEKIRLEWRERSWDTYLNANVLSDGTLRFMALCTLLLQPELPPLILIDEPELGLHPYAITLLGEMLTSVAKQTQVIVTTQSVALINQFTPEDIVVVDRKNHQSTFTRVDAGELIEWLEEYTLGELWEKNIIGGRPRNPEYPA